MHSLILDNTTVSLLTTASIILILSFCRKRLSKYIASQLFTLVQKKWSSLDKNQFVGLIIKPLGWFITVSIAILAIDSLVFPKAWNFVIYGNSFYEVLHKLGTCSVILFFIWVVTSFIDFIALVLDTHAKKTEDKRDDQIIVFFRDFFKVIVYLLGILLIVKAGFNVNLGSVLTGLSIVGAALALAAKESIENLIASFVIFFDKPFFTGDIVKTSSVLGVIEHIGLRSTRIRTNENTLVTVPNKQMVDAVVDNWSMRTSQRAEIKIELHNSNPTHLIETLMRNIQDFLDQKKYIVLKHSVHITDFNKNSTHLTVEYLTLNNSTEVFVAFKQEVYLFIRNQVIDTHIKLATGVSEINIIHNEGDNINSSSNPVI